MRRIVTGSIITLAAFAVHAGTIRNADSRSYDLAIIQSGGTTHTSIGSHTNQGSTCSYFPCTIENEDTGDEIRLSSSDQDLVIEDGKFIIR